MKTECIYIEDNNHERILYIDELVTTEYINGKIHYINNNSRLFREVRRASREHRLFCICGCQANLQLVAGEKSIKTQRFFRNYANIENFNCCYDENPLTQKSKILLRAWLNQIMQKNLLNNIPISTINKGNRKYELTYYSQEYDFGLVYANDAKNIAYEKIQELDEYREMKIMYISDIHNLIQSGQLPVHQIDMQDKQGYCIFLKINDPSKDVYLFSDAKLVCSYYIMQNLDNGVWISLPILSDYISEFSISPQGRLLYKDEPVEHYKDSIKEQYISQTKARLQKKANNNTHKITVKMPSKQSGNKTSVRPTYKKSNVSNKNSLKVKIKNIIEYRLETYNDIMFDVNLDWLEETIIDGKQCITIDLNRLDAQATSVLCQMQLYTGKQYSISRINNQIIFKGYA